MGSVVIKRGDIYRVNLEPTLGSEQQGRARPCVVLSITPFNKQFKTVGGGAFVKQRAGARTSHRQRAVGG